MAENYKPRHIQAGRVEVKSMACPNCFEAMRPAEPSGFYCANIKCRLFDVRYVVIKTLATLERQ